MESLQEFLGRRPSHKEIADMHDRNAPVKWDNPHPHGMEITNGRGPYLDGTVLRDGQEVEVRNVIDGNGQILCNSGGYRNEEVEFVRELVRASVGVDAFSTNFRSKIVEWGRAAVLDTLPPAWRDQYVLHLVASGTEANDALRRAGLAATKGRGEFINLVDGYSGAGYAASAACGHQQWEGDSTPSLPRMHKSVPDIRKFLEELLKLPPKRAPIFMFEAGNFGVGGFHNIPDEFLREAIALVRKTGDPLWKLQPGATFPDEIQTGLGRTGTTFWASERIYEGMDPPEGISIAKGIGGGHRGAATFFRKDIAEQLDGLTYHTFGENLEDLAAMGTIAQMAQRDDWTWNAAERGNELRDGLNAAVRAKAAFPFEVVGRGLMQGVVCDTAARVNAVLRRAPLDGWVCGKGRADNRGLRIAPPINVTQEVIRELIERMTITLASDEVAKAA